MQTVIKIIATVFFIGYLPVLRGTTASLVGLFLYFQLRDNMSAYIITTLFLVLLGLFVSNKAEKIFAKKDAHEITIDDATGILFALFLIPYTPFYIISAFILYRVFDVIKVPPLKKFEELKGGFGVMLDDIGAGIYANITLQILRLIFT